MQIHQRSYDISSSFESRKYFFTTENTFADKTRDSFSMAWVETWFLDFKVLPSEKKARQKALGYGYNNERSPLLRDVQSDGSGMEDPRYYSPENSDESDTEGERHEGFRGHSRQEQEYVQLGDELLETVWEIHQTDEGWKLEKGENPSTGIVHSTYCKKIKRDKWRLATRD